MAAVALSSLSMASGTLYVGLEDGTFNGVAQFNQNLSFIQQVSVSGPVDGLAAGAVGEFYAGSTNTITRYMDNGTAMGSISASGTTQLSDLSFNGSRLYASLTDGGFTGVAQFNSTLGFQSQPAVASPLRGLTHGAPGEFYTAHDNTINWYDNGGSLMGSVSATGTTVVRDLAYDGTRVYASLQDGNFNGVAIFNSSLGFIVQNTHSGFISSMTFGEGGNYYTSIDNTVFLNDMSGAVLGSISASSTTRMRDMSFRPDPVPEPATLVTLSLVGLAALRRRRKQV